MAATISLGAARACQSGERNVEWNGRGELSPLDPRMPATRQKSSKRTKHKSGALHVKARKTATATRLVPADVGEWFEKLVAVQARLRAPKGCPWDREQTHETLRTYLIEEAYEVLDALEAGDDLKFADELGDLLLQVLFHADIAREDGRFDVVDVICAIHDKMIRRHPHVFGDVAATNSAEVLRNWERIKAEERAEAKARKGDSAAVEAGQAPASVLDGVSRRLPATMEGFQLTRKAARVGFDWEDSRGVIEKIREEIGELERALPEAGPRETEEELGDLLFTAVNLARFLKIDPEIALKRANGKFVSRFHVMEGLARETGRTFAELPRDEMEKFWDRAKELEKRGSRGALPEKSRAGRGARS
jgi:tetrapyrrole methylase family protein / MazG family protein